MEWIVWIIPAIMAWALIGGVHGLVQMRGFLKKLKRFGYLNFSPNSDLRRLVDRDFNAALLLGPIGIVLVGMDWLVRNWPERLVLGGEPAKPVAIPTPTVGSDDVNLEPLRRRAGIFSDK